MEQLENMFFFDDRKYDSSPLISSLFNELEPESSGVFHNFCESFSIIFPLYNLIIIQMILFAKLKSHQSYTHPHKLMNLNKNKFYYLNYFLRKMIHNLITHFYIVNEVFWLWSRNQKFTWKTYLYKPKPLKNGSNKKVNSQKKILIL